MGVDLVFLLSIMLIIFVMLLFIVLEDRRKIVCMEKEARKQRMAEQAKDKVEAAKNETAHAVKDVPAEDQKE